MNRYFSFFMMLGLLLGGCSSVTPVTYYSLLDSGSAKQMTGEQKKMAILVGPVSVPDLLKTSQIATGDAGGRYQLSDVHRWASEVDRDFSRAIAEQLSARLGTEQVAIYPLRQYFEPTQQVVLDILAMDGNPGKDAHLSVRWALVDTKTKTTWLTRRSVLHEQPAAGGYDAWVAAQRGNINRLAEEIAAALRTAP